MSVNSSTCCPLYSIRCDALNYRLTRSQKRVLNNMILYLKYGKTDNRNNKYNLSGIHGVEQNLTNIKIFNTDLDSSLCGDIQYLVSGEMNVYNSSSRK